MSEVLRTPLPARAAPCVACGHAVVEPFAELPGMPVNVSALWATADEARSAPQGDISLGFCPSCGLVRNLAFDPARLEYGGEYENSLHHSPVFQSFERALAERLVDRYGVRDRDVVEIGSGGGDFLTLLCEIGGNRGLGFDPSYTGGGATDERVRFVVDFYSERHAGHPVDLVVCRHVLEHLEDPRGLVAGLRRTIGDRESTLYFEVPDAGFVLSDEGLWDVIYPHCSYFAAPTLRRLFESERFEVLDVGPAFGGQFLGLEARPGSLRRLHTDGAGIDALAAAVDGFAHRLRNRIESAAGALADATGRGRRVALWGAGAKGVTFLNAVAGAGDVDVVVDVNPRKQQHFVPGTGQEIVSPEEASAAGLDLVFVINPAYRDEISRTLASLGSAADVVVV